MATSGSNLYKCTEQKTVLLDFPRSPWEAICTSAQSRRPPCVIWSIWAKKQSVQVHRAEAAPPLPELPWPAKQSVQVHRAEEYPSAPGRSPCGKQSVQVHKSRRSTAWPECREAIKAICTSALPPPHNHILPKKRGAPTLLFISAHPPFPPGHFFQIVI